MKVSLSLMLCMSVVFAFSQEMLKIQENYYPRRKISSIEVLIGPSLSGILGKEEAPLRSAQVLYINPLDTKFGFCFGIGISHDVSRHFDIVAKVFYEQKGYVRSLDTLVFDANFNFVSK
ncbi:MAG: hypothetical protein ACKO96_08725, partial [Flammeovirgaceae bacterium]